MNVNAVNAHGQTALIHACRTGRSANISFLLSRGARAGIQDINGATALHYLVSSDLNSTSFNVLVRNLVEKGASTSQTVHLHGSRVLNPRINGVIFHGAPLHIAVMKNSLGAVEALLNAGAGPSQAPSQESPYLTALNMAASLLLHDLLEVLLKVSPEFNCNTESLEDGHTLLASAILGEVARHIKMHGSHHTVAAIRTVDILAPRTKGRTGAGFINRRDQTLLHCVIERGDDELLRHVLDKCYVTDLKKKWRGYSPLGLAILKRNLPVFKLLIERGSTSDLDYLMYLCAKDRYLPLSFAELLLGISTDNEVPFGMTSLYTALVHKNFALAGLLMRRRGQNINDRLSLDAVPVTAFSQILCDGPDADVLNFVLGLSGLDRPDFEVHRAYKGCILHAMCEALVNEMDSLTTKRVFGRVLEGFGEPEQINYVGEGRKMHPVGAPIHVAVENGNVEAVRALVAAGASTTLKGVEGLTPLEMVEERIRDHGGQGGDAASDCRLIPHRRLVQMRLILGQKDHGLDEEASRLTIAEVMSTPSPISLLPTLRVLIVHTCRVG
jgi:ankyrin repeat protein